MQQWLFEFLVKASLIQATTLAATCWHIWEARNDARNEKRLIDPTTLVGKISAYVENIVQFCFKPSPERRCDSSSKSHWTPPPEGRVCVNVDASFFHTEQRMGWGAVIRDHTGALKLACHEGIDGVYSPELAEALAVQRALQITKDKGFLDIILVSDCLSLIQRITAQERHISHIRAVVSDIKQLATGISSCTFNHFGRDVNVAAYLLARSSEPSSCIFYFDILFRMPSGKNFVIIFLDQ
jgi:hypothetical protein